MAIKGQAHVNQCLIFIGAMVAVMSLVPELVNGIPQSPGPMDAPSTEASMIGSGNTTTVKSDTASSATSMTTASTKPSATGAPTTSKSATPNSISSPTTTTSNPMKATPAKSTTEASYYQPTPATSAPWSIFGRPPQKPNIEIKWVPLGTLLFNKFKNHHLNRNNNPLSNFHG